MMLDSSIFKIEKLWSRSWDSSISGRCKKWQKLAPVSMHKNIAAIDGNTKINTDNPSQWHHKLSRALILSMVRMLRRSNFRENQIYTSSEIKISWDSEMRSTWMWSWSGNHRPPVHAGWKQSQWWWTLGIPRWWSACANSLYNLAWSGRTWPGLDSCKLWLFTWYSMVHLYRHNAPIPRAP